MRKLFSLFLTTLMLATLFVGAANAEGGNDSRPDLVITKLAPLSSSEGDPYEAFELVNTSGQDLNLYDYSVFYNGNAEGHKNYGLMMRLTPFKAGDYRDNTTDTFDAMPTNPDTFVMAPGEVVVARVISASTVKSAPTATEADFRAHWNIPESVRVINFDGCEDPNDSKNNFNLKNSGPAVYGIVKNDLPPVASTTTFDDAESYSSLVFDEASKPAIAGGIAVYGYNSASNKTDELEYTAEGVQFGVLTDAQKASLADLLPAEEAPAEETPAAETPAAETPAAETPAAETPAAETPAAETPAAPSTPSVPPTGDNGVFFFAAAFMLAAGGFYVCRKKRVEG